jgi:hypothetical protein
MVDSDEFELILSRICETARQTLDPHLSIMGQIETSQASASSNPYFMNDIEVGTVVSLIPTAQAPDFLGLGIVLAIQNNIFR